MKTNLKLLKNTQEYRKTKKGILTNIYQHIKHRSFKYNYELNINLSQLHNMFLNDNKFDDIYNKWVKNGFKYYDKPSIDRINPYKGYDINNIQIMTWGENRKKGDIECAIKKHKPIIMYDFDKTEIKRFNSIKEAVVFTGLNQSLIVMVCQGKRTHTGGFVFKYENKIEEI